MKRIHCDVESVRQAKARVRRNDLRSKNPKRRIMALLAVAEDAAFPAHLDDRDLTEGERRRLSRALSDAIETLADLTPEKR